jgi:hypothetical protein
MSTSTIYVLDRQNRVVSLSGGWDEFAYENGGVNLTPQDVCGRKIWEFVTGDVTRMWLEALFQHARVCSTRVERPYRCDSPDLKRFMRMCIDIEQEGKLRVEHKLISTEQRSVPLHIRYGANTNKKTRQLCSMCGRLNNNGWQEPRAEHADLPDGILVIYTVCEDCQLLVAGI